LLKPYSINEIWGWRNHGIRFFGVSSGVWQGTRAGDAGEITKILDRADEVKLLHFHAILTISNS